MKRRTKYAAGLWLALCLAGAAWLLHPIKGIPFGKSAPFQRDKVRLALSKGTITAPPILALHLGYFAEAGLDVECDDSFTSGKTAFEAMLRGEADISTAATTPVVVNSFSRNDFVILVTYSTSYEGVKIIARRDHGIATAFDLKGKTVGIVPGTISELLLNSVMAYNQILPGEIMVKAMPPGDMPAQLAAGAIDAVSVWMPYAYQALEGNKGGALQIPTSQVYRMAITLCANRDYARKNPRILKKIMLSLDRALEFMRQKPQEAQKLLADILSVDRESLAIAWKETDFRLSLDQTLLLTMEGEARWLVEHQLQNQDALVPDYLEFIDWTALEHVKPGAVTLVRRGV